LVHTADLPETTIERGVESCLIVPGSIEVIRHQIDEVEFSSNVGYFISVVDGVLPGPDCCGQ